MAARIIHSIRRIPVGARFAALALALAVVVGLLLTGNGNGTQTLTERGSEALAGPPLGVYLTGGESEGEAKQPRLEAESYPLTIAGRGLITFTNPQNDTSVECKGVDLQDKLAAAASELDLVPAFGQCTAFGEKATVPATLKAHSCHYTAHLQNADPPYGATLDVACEEEGDAIEYLIYVDQGQLEKEEVFCAVRIAPKEDLEGVSLRNIGRGPGRRVSLEIEAAGIDWENGCDGKTHSDGILSGKVRLGGNG